MEYLLSHNAIVVKRPESSSLSLVWELWSINQHVSVDVHLSVLRVSDNSWNGIDAMVEALFSMVHGVELIESLNAVALVMETWSKNQSLVSQSLSVC